MATDCTKILDPLSLVREGTRQSERLPEALKPGYVNVDERGPAQRLVFAKQFAEYVRFFDQKNQVDGDWRSFFERDPSMLLAVAAVQDVDFYRSTVQEYFRFLLDDANQADEAGLKKNLGHLFNAVGSLAWRLEALKVNLPKEIPLKGILENLIRTDLAPSFTSLIGYYKAAVSDGLVDVGSTYSWDILGESIEQFPVSYQKSFSSDWITDPLVTDWTVFHQAITSDASIFGGMTSVFHKLNHAAAHNLFTGTFDFFVKAYARTVAEALVDLDKNFTGKDDHEPHYSLFLAFLRLLEYVRSSANSLTGKHLDFYYNEVLRLKEKAAEPNHAHLLVELAKNQVSHLLKADTTFAAGKDSAAKEVVYALDEDFVPNIAKVASLKSVYHTVHEAASTLYAFPVVNSGDGLGGDFSSPDKQWPPYRGKTEPANLARVGFAISSHYLFLAEGLRRIDLLLSFDKAPDEGITQSDFCRAFDFHLSGEKGWVAATLDKASLDVAGKITTSVTIPLILDGSLPPIVPLNRAAHGNEFPEGLPTLRAVLKQEIGGKVRLSNLQKLVVNPAKCELAVCVGYDSFKSTQPSADGGLKKLTVITKSGELNPDKPFQPFGPLPTTEDSLILGSDEVFQKQGAKFQFSVKWKGLPDWRGYIDFDWFNAFGPSVKMECLSKGTWQTASFEPFLASESELVTQALDRDTGEVQIFFGKQSHVYFPSKKTVVEEDSASGIHFDRAGFSLDSRNGFFKCTLLADFGHKLYRNTLTEYLIKKATGKINTEKSLYTHIADYYNGGWGQDFESEFIERFSNFRPVEPYTPEIDSITLSYVASVKLSDAAVNRYWLTSFGYEPMNSSLLPQYQQEGEFYVGVSALKPPQNLSLLFQLAEGSANPTVKKPAEHVKWSYLSDGTWTDFQESEISDATGQLTRSGIIRFSVPKGATADDTLFLPSGNTWLRASVAERSDAVCNIITVSAQAAKVTFEDRSNASDFLAAQSPQGTISKLLVPDAAVKKVEQPYPTFGGRAKESNVDFHIRVSERLRHKNRAIDAWDYEHLILEAFPHIYKVKCLNHTEFDPGDTSGTSTYNELAPGHVTVIAIPNLRNQNAKDPLRPYTNLGDLELIRSFLEKHVSCFVRLHVHNPIFEPVRVSLRVKFVPGTDEAFHTALLQNELVRFLSPWAFEEGKDVTFGGKIYKSSIIDFLDEQVYVDYVTDVQLFHPENGIDGTDLEEVEPSTALSILVSAPATDHTVVPIHEEVSPQAVPCSCGAEE